MKCELCGSETGNGWCFCATCDEKLEVKWQQWKASLDTIYTYPLEYEKLDIQERDK